MPPECWLCWHKDDDSSIQQSTPTVPPRSSNLSPPKKYICYVPIIGSCSTTTNKICRAPSSRVLRSTSLHPTSTPDGRSETKIARLGNRNHDKIPSKYLFMVDSFPLIIQIYGCTFPIWAYLISSILSIFCRIMLTS